MKKKWRGTAVCYFVLTLCAVIWLYPIGVAIIKSFHLNGFDNYKYVLTYDKISYFRVVGNSMFIAITSALAVTFIVTLAAFAFSKMTFYGKKLIYGAILACLAVPVAAVTSPLFAAIKTLGFLDKHVGVIMPLIAFNAPMMLLMVKNYFDTIPDELLESARMDGASTMRIWYEFMIPLCVPIIANVLVLTFIYSWNDYLVPLLVMRDQNNYTVTLAAQYFMSSTYQSPTDVARIYAVMMLLTLPSILVYLVSQKFLVSGITAGSVKG